mmetsp:Transcript_49177/g.119186  ORF Transcript_49177/g.119186 Transcript_49177/m.119186 type:complete len:781 (+) Transcript_49177:381-2723(+)
MTTLAEKKMKKKSLRRRRRDHSRRFYIQDVPKIQILWVLILLFVVAMDIYIEDNRDLQNRRICLFVHSSSSGSSSSPSINRTKNINNNDETTDAYDDLYEAFILRQIMSSSLGSGSSSGSVDEGQQQQQQQQSPPHVMILKAIEKCRTKLLEDPQFYNAHQMLSVLLESIAEKSSSASTISQENKNDDVNIDDKDLVSKFMNRLWMEVADSSWNAVRYSSTDTITTTTTTTKDDSTDSSSSPSFLLDDKTLVECLLRSARALTMIDNNYRSDSTARIISNRLVEVYRLVLPMLEDINDVEAILTQATILFFSKRAATATAMTTSTALLDFYDLSDLAARLVERFPSSILIRQFQGAVFRKTGDSINVYHAYLTSAKLAQEQFNEKSIQDVVDVNFLEKTVQSHILAASAIKETGSVPIKDALDLLNSALFILNNFEQLQEESNNVNEQENYGSSRLSPSSKIAKLYVEVYNTFGVIYKASGNTQEAIKYFRRSLSYNPSDGHALVQLASLDALPSTESGDIDPAATATNGVKSLDNDYVADLFDGYSDRFENELVSLLQYQGHEWVAKEVLEYMKRRVESPSSNQECKSHFTVVDLGCGTGLVGQSLRIALDLPSTDIGGNLSLNNIDVRLLGVDLSPRMVEISRLKEYKTTKVYDQVDEDDGVKYLSRLVAGRPSSIDCIVAADVFIYIGDLDKLFQVASEALGNDSVLIFSVEQLLPGDDTRSDGLKLLQSGRFGHTKAYIEQTASRYGLELKLWRDGTLRKQRGDDVQGAVVVLEKE